MNPIPTVNAMKPAPGKGVSSFPTPVIKDTVIVEVVNAWKGDYTPLEYGAKWDEHPHASVQGSFPDHKLISQAPNSEDGQWVKRIWANDRVDQDTYNYAIKYSAGSDQHPIYIRTYLEPRDTYAPVPDNSPDPLFPGAVLVDEEVTRTEGEFDSRYVQVTRVYETLPGPVVPTQRYNERGDLETVSTQTVAPGTAPEPDGLLVTQSQVVQEEVSKGVKTTATVPSHSQLLIKEKKEGLLGETVTTDDIVDPATNPDNLSTTIVGSTVQQISKTKAVKRTTTASGPASLTQKNRDGKLLGDVTITESVVAPNANADAVSSSVLSSEVKQTDSGKAIKRNTVLNSTPTLLGSDTKSGLLGITSTTETVVNAGSQADAPTLSIISSTVEPIDSVRSRKVTQTSTGPTSLSGAQKREGLLGETAVTESIVAAGSQADNLSQTIVSSEVTPIDSAKSKKTTVVSTGPTSLTQKSKDGKLLGDVTVTESIVDPNTNPDSPSGVTTGILTSEIRQIDSGKAVKKNTSLNSTPTLVGSDVKSGLLGITITEETVVAAGSPATPLSQTVVASSVEPIDNTRSRRVVQTSLGPKVLVGRQRKEGLLGETTVTEAIVSSTTQPENLSSTVLSSEVSPIDSAKSKRTTITSSGPTSLSGNKKGEGLLGETTITESIVAAGASADPLSQTIVSSEVTPIDSAKSRKTNVVSSGPTSLTQKSRDGKLLGNTTLTQSIVGPSSSPDAVSQSILSSEVKQIDSGKAQKNNIVIDSKPTLTSRKSGSGLMGNTRTVETIVPAVTQADGVTTVILESTVESINEAISKKATTFQEGPTSLVGRSRKEGLLGETTITESIVTASSQADPLSRTVVSSEISPIDSAKSKKTTVVSTGPTSLTQRSKDGKLLGDVTVTESIVAPSAQADATSGSTSGVLSSEIRQIDSGKAVKRNTVLNSTPTLLGSETKPGLLGTTTTEETVVASGTPATDLSQTIVASSVEPIDATRSRRIVQTASGPTSLSGQQKKEGLLGETTVTESIVAAGAPADPLSTTVLSSEVSPIDASKSKKTTVVSTGPKSLTGKQNKEGLLGETIITEEIVPIGEQPDPLDFTTISSEVTPIDSVKAKKTTITSIGPTVIQTAGLFNSPVGLVSGIGIKEIVPAEQDSSFVGFGLLEARTTQIDESKKLVEYSKTDLYPELSGVEYDNVLGIPIEYEKTVVTPNSYKNQNWNNIANVEYDPVDQWKTVKTQYNKDKIKDALESQYYSFETQVDVSLPDKLLEATVYWSKDNGKGKQVATNPEVSGDSYSYTESYSHDSDANVTGDIFFKIEKGFRGPIPGNQHTFFVEIGNDGRIDKSVLRLLIEKSGTDYQKWPVIKSISENIVIVSGSKRQSLSFTKGESVSINGYAKRDREDESFSIDRNANSVTVPDTIHPSITITKNEIGTFGDVPPPEYSIFPTILAATPIPKFPSGQYLISSNIELYKWGFVRVTAITANVTEEYT